MKLDSGIYSEAQRVVRTPKFRYIILGLVGAAVVPTAYMRRGYTVPAHSLDNINGVDTTKASVMGTEQRAAMTKGKSLQEMMDDDEVTYLMFSSIM
ncbi:XXYS1_4_G0037610.mRNA.1.CDS.1 [Saccharomyces cerevisiae]|nr:EM14S01-3B_G0035020.mRNA.1.CDS.1 [Saccharomyces cerevisiae]CAD6626759.1 XXYS1_4_G0037610.mRNA.1.CDS.1 [Saccharomyces cerevisiae]CAI4497099.1 AMH_1a_G0022040.mRNA.1.CDS.1 [Saccharomyces cerevisiae]CAI4505867.1 CEI_1a_G0021960.mRNA.1.CDS.1 [Saccharomyces cerevisiae]CAI6689989.1 AMH_1a_G0022040.mRNA.1.CDS.1 [Saccharomyces cerevisiae]